MYCLRPLDLSLGRISHSAELVMKLQSTTWDDHSRVSQWVIEGGSTQSVAEIRSQTFSSFFITIFSCAHCLSVL